jgi:phytoene dehydrogenase-like protein
VTEEVWPGQRVSRASYVVSMLQPKVVSELELARFGYSVIPLDPSFATFAADGRPIVFGSDETVARESPRDAAALPRFEAMLARMAGLVRPLLLRPPTVPSLLRAVRRRHVHELFRVMTMSVGDLLDEWFETDAIKGAYASTGVVGVWAGPRTPGTAYNLLHHELGELNGVGGLWGHVKGGMGGISQALARSAEAAGATIRTGAAVRAIDVEGGRATGVTLESGEQLEAPLVVSGAHPRTTILDLTGAEHFPDEVVRDMRRYRSRGGSVKVNCILSEPPRYERASPEERERLLRTGIAVCPSIDYLERAWQDAVRGEPAAGPYVEIEVPTTVDPTLTDDGSTVMTLFTQYGPHREEDWADGAREAYAERCLDIVAEHAPNVKDALVHYEVLAPPDLEDVFGLVDGSIFQGEQGLDQMGFMRPAPLLARYATPVDGLYLCGAGTHPGGGVMAACGHNAAQRILRDRRRRRRFRPGRVSAGRANAPGASPA